MSTKIVTPLDGLRFLQEPIFIEALQEVQTSFYAPPIYANQLLHLMIAYTVLRAVGVSKTTSYVVDRDLDTSVPKRWREYAMEVAERLGYFKKIEWRGNPAWERTNKPTPPQEFSLE